MGDERPWIAGNLNHYRRAYEKYLAMTPWKGAKKQGGKRIYMLLYHGMDYLTAVCPAMRWEISKRLGMKVVDARKQSGTAAGVPESAKCQNEKPETAEHAGEKQS